MPPRPPTEWSGNWPRWADPARQANRFSSKTKGGQVAATTCPPRSLPSIVSTVARAGPRSRKAWTSFTQSRWRFLPAAANGQLAFGTYLWDETERKYVPAGLDILTIRNARVEVTTFLTADLSQFGLLARIGP